jgi:hypothetical protein
MTNDVGMLLKREFAVHFEKERIVDPVLVILCLKSRGLSNDLAMRVLFAELPEEISVKFINHVQDVIYKRKRRELKLLLQTLNPMLGLRVHLLPARACVARLTKPVLVNEIVKGILLGPETEADRLREITRLQLIYTTLQQTLEVTPARRRPQSSLLPPNLPRCIWCKKAHAKRGFLKCANACIMRCQALSSTHKAVQSRYELVNVLRRVNVNAA